MKKLADAGIHAGYYKAALSGAESIEESDAGYVKKFGDASRLTAIPLGIAGWLRYMLGVDDKGNTYELSLIHI